VPRSLRHHPRRGHGRLSTTEAYLPGRRRPEVQVPEQWLGSLPDVVTVRPFSVNTHSYPVQ
jgi:hypothetical protein